MVYDWVHDLCSSNSIKHKERVIEKALVASRLGSMSAEYFLYNSYLCYNPNFKYGLKKVPTVQWQKLQENPWLEFWGLCESIRTNAFSNYSQICIGVTAMSKRFDSVQWNYVCSRVLMKDLQCGVNRNTFNRVLGNTEWRIPAFGEL